MKMWIVGAVVLGCFAVVIFLGLTIIDSCSCDDEKLTLKLDQPEVAKQWDEDLVSWDVNLHILGVTPKDERVQWSDVRVVVKSADGSILDDATPLVADGSGGTNDGPGPKEFLLVDADGNGMTTAEDTIRLTGLSEEYRGATVEVVVLDRDERIGSITLPSEFP